MLNLTAPETTELLESLTVENCRDLTSLAARSMHGVTAAELPAALFDQKMAQKLLKLVLDEHAFDGEAWAMLLTDARLELAWRPAIGDRKSAVRRQRAGAWIDLATARLAEIDGEEV
jgi:hypothetical protein